MKRLILKNRNTSEEYDRIFQARELVGPDWQDIRRWKKLLNSYRGGPLLDIGCLDSLVPVMAKTMHPEDEIIGIDIAKQAIWSMHLKYPSIEFEVGDLYAMDYMDGWFKYVVMGEVLEHLEYPDRAVKEAMRVLQEKGTLAISVPLDEAKEPGAVDAHHHLWSFTVQDIIDLLKPYGNVKTSILGSQYISAYKYAWPSLLAFVKKKKL